MAVVTAPISLDALIRRVQGPGTGALAAFLGTVRNVNDGRAVRGMDYEAYGPMAEAELGRIVAETLGQVPGVAIAVEHRVGTLAVGDVSVAVVASHPHRAPAFEAARRIIEELKRRVPIWKREHYAEGDWEWLDPTAPRG
ncbi:MAG: molybdenum cofactor biosynthesis protein MoaE [Gemmatimonadetes bacterium]|nr:molybdenum cofactor biosynthesis protein MoaE [Gemmatimonadota bacterium]